MLLLVAGCQTIKQKTDEIVEKENEKLSKYISKSASILQMDLGKPDEDFTNSKGNYEFVYNTKGLLKSPSCTSVTGLSSSTSII